MGDEMGDEMNQYEKHGMSKARYAELSKGDGKLTEEEIKNGWFFDDEYDGLLANRAWEGHEGY